MDESLLKGFKDEIAAAAAGEQRTYERKQKLVIIGDTKHRQFRPLKQCHIHNPLVGVIITPNLYPPFRFESMSSKEILDVVLIFHPSSTVRLLSTYTCIKADVDFLPSSVTYHTNTRCNRRWVRRHESSPRPTRSQKGPTRLPVSTLSSRWVWFSSGCALRMQE